MARKIYYRRPLKFFWQELYATQKKLTPYFSDDQIFAILRHNILTAPERSFGFPEMRGLMVSGLELWREDAAGELMHIFFWTASSATFCRTPLSRISMGSKSSFMRTDKTMRCCRISEKGISVCCTPTILPLRKGRLSL